MLETAIMSALKTTSVVHHHGTDNNTRNSIVINEENQAINVKIPCIVHHVSKYAVNFDTNRNT